MDSSVATDSSPLSNTYHDLETLGTFTKLTANSAITLVWTSHASGGNGSSTVCDYQLRIDGADDQGYTGTNVSAEPVSAETGAAVYDANASFSVTDVFTGLSTALTR